MNEISYATACDGRVRHFEGSDGPSENGFDWLPLAEGRYVDIPVASSKGRTFMVLPIEFDVQHYVEWTLRAKPLSGPCRVTKAGCEAAIERLSKFVATLDG